MNYFKNLTAKLCLNLAILLALSLTAFAQAGASISGKITENQQPIANATVQLREFKNVNNLNRTQTNANGEYSFDNVLNGKYKLEILVGGFQTNSRTHNLEVLGKDIEFNSEGDNQTPSIYESVTIAAGTEQDIEETSKSVSIIGNKELNNRNEITITDALRTVPGLRVQQSGGFGRLTAIKIRGLRNQDTAVLIDGQRFRDAAAIAGDASPFLSDLQVTNVESIEVLRGSGSSLYGTNAIGGVFDVKTDNFQKGFRGNLLSEAGSLGEFRGRASFAGDLGDKAFYNLGLSHTNFSKGVDGDDDARNTSAKASARFELSDYANLTGRFYFSDAFVKLNSNPDFVAIVPADTIVNARPLSRSELRRYESGAPRTSLNFADATFIPDASDPDNNQASRFYNFNVALDGAINSFANYRASYQNLTTTRINRNGSAGVAPASFSQPSGNDRGDFQGNIQTLQAKSDIVLRSNTLTVGYEFEREKYGNDNFAVNSNVISDFVDSVQTSNTIFAQNQIQAFDRRLQLSGAIRAQFFKLEQPRLDSASPFQNIELENPPNAYTADGSLAYFFRSTGTKLRGHVGNGYRVPSLFERFYNSFGTIYGDPNLKPERSIAVDAGIDQNLASNRVRLSATYFYTRLIDVIGFSFPARLIGTTPRPFGGYLTQPGFIARGGELSAQFKPFATTEVFTSYTFTNSDQRSPQVSGSGVIQTLGVPNQQFTAVITQQLFDRLTLNFDFVGTGSYLSNVTNQQTFSTRIYRFDGNRKGDLTASYEIPTSRDKLRVRLFGTVENIFNQDYYENGFRTARTTARGGIALSF